MIKKLKSSLTAKIFLLTALLLIVCCIATYAFIAWLIPQTYPTQVDIESAEIYAYEAAQELRNINIEDYPPQAQALQDMAQVQFGQDIELHIFNDAGYEISLVDFLEQTDRTVSDYIDAERTQEYHFTFANNTGSYYLFYIDNSQSVNQAVEAVGRVFPYLLITVLLIALLTSFIYSKYITAPIKKINRASQKMATMDFKVKCVTNRTDELGRVSNNLNVLAEALSSALCELEQANAKLADDFNREKQMEVQRTELFSSISHELKTPITIVKGQLQGMIGGVGRYKDKDTYLVKSLETVTHLETMVQELLAVSRMETPGYACNREPFDLADLIKRCLVAQEDLFIQKDMELVRNTPQTLTYEGDPRLLKRVFDNLIANALAYSPAGNSIIANLTGDGAIAKFSIENTGVHIDEDDLSQVFEAFSRADKSRNRQTGGSGLGLYIVKKIFDLHGVQYGIKNTTDGVVFSILF